MGMFLGPLDCQNVLVILNSDRLGKLWFLGVGGGVICSLPDRVSSVHCGIFS